MVAGGWQRRVLKGAEARNRDAIRTESGQAIVLRCPIHPHRGRSPLSLFRRQASTVSKPNAATVDRLVQELMNRHLTKAERMQRLRELVQSGEDVPDELMSQALRKLMDSLTD
jgi:hypothetical protein